MYGLREKFTHFVCIPKLPKELKNINKQVLEVLSVSGIKFLCNLCEHAKLTISTDTPTFHAVLKESKTLKAAKAKADKEIATLTAQINALQVEYAQYKST